MNTQNFIILINIVSFLVLYVFVTRHIGAFLGFEQPIGLILALIPSIFSKVYYKKLIEFIEKKK